MLTSAKQYIMDSQIDNRTATQTLQTTRRTVETPQKLIKQVHVFVSQNPPASESRIRRACSSFPTI